MKLKHTQMEKRKREYKKANRKDRGIILDELTKSLGYHREYIRRCLLEPPMSGKRRYKQRARKYDDKVISSLKWIWQNFNQLCSVRLHQQIPLVILSVRKELGISKQTEQLLLQISARQIERLLREFKTGKRRKVNQRAATTRAKSLSRKGVDVSIRRPENPPPGILEIDSVSHCGSRASGQFIWTVNMVDVRTGWVTAFPVLGHGSDTVVQGLEECLKYLPFKVLEIHSDNGSEFINRRMFYCCKKNKIYQTRSRPGHKNDNPRVECRNFTNVRNNLGYGRMDTSNHLIMLQEILYRCNLLSNFFEPNERITKSERREAKSHRKYDQATTPLDRLVGYYRDEGKALPPKVKGLLALRKQMMPDVKKHYDHVNGLINQLRSLPLAVNEQQELEKMLVLTMNKEKIRLHA